MYTQEIQFPEIMENEITTFWQQREEGYIKGVSNKRLFWVSLTSPNHTKAVVVINGRVESAWKYQEIFYDLFQQGFDVYSFDHRGQGLSERLVEDQQIGYVDNFSDYIDDMALLVDSFNLNHYQHRFILAHSMGGAIATRYIQNYPAHNFDAIALSAPMYGVTMPWYQKPIARYLTPVIATLVSKPTYISKNRAYYAKPFDINPLTSSLPRYTWFRELYERQPKLKLGGPSARWVWQGLVAAEQCIRNAHRINIPLLLLQGTADKIVSNQAQHKFINQLNKTNSENKLVIIEGSKHEILFESDKYRNLALENTIRFFSAI
mgnify:CR=1 FL=1